MCLYADAEYVVHRLCIYAIHKKGETEQVASRYIWPDLIEPPLSQLTSCLSKTGIRASLLLLWGWDLPHHLASPSQGYRPGPTTLVADTQRDAQTCITLNKDRNTEKVTQVNACRRYQTRHVPA